LRTFVAYPTSSSHAATSSLLPQGKGNNNDKVVAERVSPERTGRALRGCAEHCDRYKPDSPRCLGFSRSCSHAQTHWHPQGCRIPALKDALRSILELEQEQAFTVSPADEDVHTSVENYLVAKAGAAGK